MYMVYCNHMTVKTRYILALFIIISTTFAAESNYELIIKGNLSRDVFTNVINKLNKYNAKNYNSDEINTHSGFIIKEIKESLQPYGYFSPIIKYYTKKNNDKIKIFFDIEQGARIKYSKVTLAKELEPFIDNLKIIKAGDYFDVKAYEETKKQIKHKLTIAGYAKATLEKSSVEVDLTTQSATAVIAANLGEKYEFGKVIYQEDIISKSQITKYLTFTPGEIYSKDKLSTSRKQLIKSGLFKAVDIAPKFVDGNNTVDIKIKVKFKEKNSYQVGVGYDTDQRFRLTFDATNNYLSDSGDKSIYSIKASDTEIKTGFDYYMPGFDPKTETEILSVFLDTKADEDIGDSKYINTSFTKKYKFDDYVFGKSINIHYEKSEPNNANSYLSTLIYPSIAQNYKGSITSKLKYNWTNNLMASLQGAGSTVSMAQGKISNTLSYQITPRARFTNKITLGATLTDDFDSVPLSFKFTAGGSNSIRGYSYDSFGPNKFLKLMSNELSFKLFEDISATLFVDIGNVTDTLNDGKFYVGAGPGISWNTPIGSANISLAYAMSYDGKPWKIQFKFQPNP